MTMSEAIEKVQDVYMRIKRYYVITQKEVLVLFRKQAQNKPTVTRNQLKSVLAKVFSPGQVSAQHIDAIMLGFKNNGSDGDKLDYRRFYETFYQEANKNEVIDEDRHDGSLQFDKELFSIIQSEKDYLVKQKYKSLVDMLLTPHDKDAIRTSDKHRLYVLQEKFEKKLPRAHQGKSQAGLKRLTNAVQLTVSDETLIGGMKWKDRKVQAMEHDYKKKSNGWYHNLPDQDK